MCFRAFFCWRRREVIGLSKIKWFAVPMITMCALMFGYPYALGWLAGCLAVWVLRKNRERFYNRIMDMTSFNVMQYVAYTVSVIAIIGGSFLVAFKFMNVVNPYTLFAAFFAERIYLFFSRILLKGDSHHVST